MTDAAPAPTPSPPAGGEALAPTQTAQTEIARLTSGADVAFSAAYTDPSAPGHREAVDKMTELHKAAFPDEGETQQSAATASQELPFAYPADMPVEAMQELQTLAHETIAAVGLAPEVAHGGIAILESAIATRGGSAMNSGELAEFESMLEAKWGADYNSKLDIVEASLAKAGKGRDLLRRSILAAGPQTAVWAFETLAGVQSRVNN